MQLYFSKKVLLKQKMFSKQAYKGQADKAMVAVAALHLPC